MVEHKADVNYNAGVSKLCHYDDAHQRNHQCFRSDKAWWFQLYPCGLIEVQIVWLINATSYSGYDPKQTQIIYIPCAQDITNTSI